jgi:hypothetical protein
LRSRINVNRSSRHYSREASLKFVVVALKHLPMKQAGIRS